MAPWFVRQAALERGLAEAGSWEDFRSRTLELDRVCGLDAWKRRLMGSVVWRGVTRGRFECADYDYDLVRDVLDDLFRARRSGTPRHALYLLRATLRRNLGGA